MKIRQIFVAMPVRAVRSTTFRCYYYRAGHSSGAALKELEIEYALYLFVEKCPLLFALVKPVYTCKGTSRALVNRPEV